MGDGTFLGQLGFFRVGDQSLPSVRFGQLKQGASDLYNGRARVQVLTELDTSAPQPNEIPQVQV